MEQDNGGDARRARPRRAATTHFADRTTAGRELARRLGPLAGRDTLILGLPNGGLSVAEPVALELGADLDVFLSCKIRAPSQPELAIGAVAEGEITLWNVELGSALGLDSRVRDRQLEYARHELEARRAAFRAVLPRAPIAGRPVILVDDGVATGATFRAALDALFKEGPESLVAALPGGPPDTLAELASHPAVDELIALAHPPVFLSVAQLYDSFEPVTPRQACEILRSAAARRCVPA